MRTEFPDSYHRIQRISLLGGVPKIFGEARRLDVESSLRCHRVAQPRSMAQPFGLAALDTIVDGVERQDRVREHLGLNAQVLSPDIAIRSREVARLKLQAAEN